MFYDWKGHALLQGMGSILTSFTKMLLMIVTKNWVSFHYPRQVSHICTQNWTNNFQGFKKNSASLSIPIALKFLGSQEVKFEWNEAHFRTSDERCIYISKIKVTYRKSQQTTWHFWITSPEILHNAFYVLCCGMVTIISQYALSNLEINAYLATIPYTTHTFYGTPPEIPIYQKWHHI